MKQNSILRAEARAALKGKWAVSALFTFVYCIVASIISSISGANYGNEGLMFGTSFIGMLLICPLAYGMIIGFLDVFRGNSLEIETLFSGYKSRIWGTLALKYIYIVLWTLLLIIPGIIKTYSYSINNAAIEKSMEMMQGHKLRLFLLHLSFIGWAILAVLTFGIGFLWVIPYAETSQAAFYEDLKAQQEPIIEEV